MFKSLIMLAFCKVVWSTDLEKLQTNLGDLNILEGTPSKLNYGSAINDWQFFNIESGHRNGDRVIENARKKYEKPGDAFGVDRDGIVNGIEIKSSENRMQSWRGGIENDKKNTWMGWSSDRETPRYSMEDLANIKKLVPQINEESIRNDRRISKGRRGRYRKFMRKKKRKGKGGEIPWERGVGRNEEDGGVKEGEQGTEIPRSEAESETGNNLKSEEKNTVIEGNDESSAVSVVSAPIDQNSEVGESETKSEDGGSPTERKGTESENSTSSPGGGIDANNGDGGVEGGDRSDGRSRSRSRGRCGARCRGRRRKMGFRSRAGRVRRFFGEEVGEEVST